MVRVQFENGPSATNCNANFLVTNQFDITQTVTIHIKQRKSITKYKYIT